MIQIGYIIKKSHKKILQFLFGYSAPVIAAAAVTAPVIGPILAPVAPLIAASAPILASAALSEADRFTRNRYWSADNERDIDNNHERDREIAEDQAEKERLWRVIEYLNRMSKNVVQQRAKSPGRGALPGPKRRNTRNC